MGSSRPNQFSGIFEIISCRVLGKVTLEHRKILEGLTATFSDFAGGFHKS